MHPERSAAACAAAYCAVALGACRTPREAADAAPVVDASVEVRDAGDEHESRYQVPTERPIGPYELPLDAKRAVFYVVPRHVGRGRLLANLHGVCNPPGYACGYWVNAGADAGFLVCPAGNSTCGANGPPTWTEPASKIDDDLERAIALVDAKYPGEIDRDGAILTGFSLGAYSAAQIARTHPGRWPYLILNEANVDLDASWLRTAGVRAVAMLAGERGAMIAGEKKTVSKLEKQGFPARFWTMKDAGHYYSADIDALMAEAIAFVTSQTPDASP